MNVLYVSILHSFTRISTLCATQRPPLTSISRMFRLSGPYRTSLSCPRKFPHPLILSSSVAVYLSCLSAYRDAFSVSPFVRQMRDISHGSLGISKPSPPPTLPLLAFRNAGLPDSLMNRSVGQVGPGPPLSIPTSSASPAYPTSSASPAYPLPPTLDIYSYELRHGLHPLAFPPTLRPRCYVSG